MAKRKREELQLVRRSDLTLVVSPTERAILERACPGALVRVISTICSIEERQLPGLEHRRTIIFIGGFEHPPNSDAVLYFANEIFPRVRAVIPDAVFQVIGPDPPPEVRSLSCSHIEILGYIADIRPYFDQARLSVAPLRFGAGVKGKVNQSMAHRRSHGCHLGCRRRNVSGSRAQCHDRGRSPGLCRCSGPALDLDGALGKDLNQRPRECP